MSPVAHNCVDYCQTLTPGLGNFVAEQDAILVPKGMRISKTAEKRTILYESSCTLYNPQQQEGTRKKMEHGIEGLKEQKGIYVGESARSIFERAREHKQDAEDRSEDYHMVKHW